MTETDTLEELKALTLKFMPSESLIGMIRDALDELERRIADEPEKSDLDKAIDALAEARK